MTAKTGSLVRTIFWAAMAPAAYLLGWLNSVVFVSLVSIWALVETAYAAWRSDVNPNQDQMDRIEAMVERLRGDQ